MRPESRWLVDSVNSKKAVATSSEPRRARRKLDYGARTSAIVSARTQKMREIDALRRDNPDAGNFALKAQTLLTRDWSKASWHARENILRTVTWLLRMETAARRRVSVPDPDHSERAISFP